VKKLDGISDQVRACLERRNAFAASLGAEADQVVLDEPRLAQLIERSDFGSPPVLDEVVRLKVKLEVWPQRLAAREGQLEGLDQELLSLCHRLVSEQLSPVGVDLEARAAAKARAELREHFPDAESLFSAAMKSVLVLEIQLLRGMVKIDYAPMEGVSGYANNLLGMPDKFAAFAKKCG